MAKWKFEGVEELLSYYKELSDDTRECVGKAVYEGAGYVADAVKSATQALPVNNQYNSGGITSVQKKGLIDGFGISRMKDDNGYVNVKLGFDGYNGQKTKQYPNGQPNAVIARSVNSGSSFRKKIPFVDNATKAAKARCEEIMKNTVEESIEKINTKY